MIRGLYTSASGMLAESLRNDVAANNLANVNSAGFKKDTASFKAFPEILMRRMRDNLDRGQAPAIGNLGAGAIVDEVSTMFSPGQLKQTENPFDLALEGNNYFTVETPNGNMYTKNGSFGLDGNGYLVTAQGNYVLGQKGRIKVVGQNFNVSPNGQVAVDGTNIDTLLISSFGNPRTELKKVGDTLFTGNPALPKVQGRVLQGYLESSNVNAVNEMVDLITIMRSYEANQKAIQAHDSTLDKAVNQVGSLR